MRGDVDEANIVSVTGEVEGRLRRKLGSDKNKRKPCLDIGDGPVVIGCSLMEMRVVELFNYLAS